MNRRKFIKKIGLGAGACVAAVAGLASDQLVPFKPFPSQILLLRALQEQWTGKAETVPAAKHGEAMEWAAALEESRQDEIFQLCRLNTGLQDQCTQLTEQVARLRNMTVNELVEEAQEQWRANRREEAKRA